MQKINEFYQGWMVELIHSGGWFKFVCFSPLGENLSDSTLYQTHQLALQAAIQLIDQFFACCALRGMLREIYEADDLTFDEWQQLSQSLEYISRTQFTQLPS